MACNQYVYSLQIEGGLNGRRSTENYFFRGLSLWSVPLSG